MATDELIKDIKRRLEPATKELNSRLCVWSESILQEQALDDESLFWRIPCQLIKNLQRLLGPDPDRRLDFFRTCHRSRYRDVLGDIPQSVVEETLTLTRRCNGPSMADVQEFGLLPFQLHLKLQRRKLLQCVGKEIGGPKLELSAPGEYVQSVACGPWTIETAFCLRPRNFQLQLSHDVRISPGGPYIDRWLSLHGVLGVFVTAWDMALPGDEEIVAQQVGKYNRFMVGNLCKLLDRIHPAVSRSEVEEAVQEWTRWLDDKSSRTPKR